jgi:hypothetical protein
VIGESCYVFVRSLKLARNALPKIPSLFFEWCPVTLAEADETAPLSCLSAQFAPARNQGAAHCGSAPPKNHPSAARSHKSAR